MPVERAIVTQKTLEEMEHDLSQRLRKRLLQEPISEKPLFPTSMKPDAEKMSDGVALLEALLFVFRYRERTLRGFGDVSIHWNEWMALMLQDWETLKQA